MIADPAKLGKMMHLVAQNHLLNKKHFKLNDYVEEVLKLQMAETEAELKGIAKRLKELLVISAEMGEGKTVSPAARDLCRKADHKRYSDLERKYKDSAMTAAVTAALRGKPHEQALGQGTVTALHTIERCHHVDGTGAPGYRVSDFNKKSAITRALNAFLIAKPAPLPHHQQAQQAQASQGLQSPYTFESQEFLRHCLFEDFESTLARAQTATAKTGPIGKMAALKQDKRTDDSTKAMLNSLGNLNKAVVGATLNQITPKDYDRHVEMADLHEKALAILNSTHTANGKPLDTDEKARMDRAKVKVAYYLMKALSTDVHTEVVINRKKRDENAIAADRDAAVAVARNLHDEYNKKLAQGGTALADWAETLT
jgi:hypothetical protein